MTNHVGHPTADTRRSDRGTDMRGRTGPLCIRAEIHDHCTGRHEPDGMGQNPRPWPGCTCGNQHSSASSVSSWVYAVRTRGSVRQLAVFAGCFDCYLLVLVRETSVEAWSRRRVLSVPLASSNLVEQFQWKASMKDDRKDGKPRENIPAGA